MLSGRDSRSVCPRDMPMMSPAAGAVLENLRSMQRDTRLKSLIRILIIGLAGTSLVSAAFGDSCTTQAQMSAALRQQLVTSARSIVDDIQSGDISSLRSALSPAVAADFNGIAASANSLKPMIQGAGITVDTLIAFTAASQTGASGQDQFFCRPSNSEKMIVLTFQSLPAGSYALALLHATGVKKPQQIALILSQNASKQWQLGGFFAKPLTMDGQSGVWYWSRARQFAGQKADWTAWFYYQIAQSLSTPVNFLTSPNLQQLRSEANRIRPANLPGASPIMIDANGQSFQVTQVDTTTQFGPLDLAVTYAPNPSQSAVLRNPVEARKQVVDLVSAMLRLHPTLRKAFHGVWVEANSGNATVYALELPMDQIPAGS